MEKDIDCIVSTLKKAHINNKKRKGATLLIGAGCSVSAGIPLAPDIVKDIKEQYPEMVDDIGNDSYQDHMNALFPDERQIFINKYIDKAMLNWAHIGIAQLIKEGYVTRILTVNFDPLVIRACALVNEYPAVYDIPSIATFKRNKLADPSVNYLHGQHTGMKIVHTKEDDKKIKKTIDLLIEDSINERPIIVVGYSGVSDQILESLCKINEFGSGLYWICYKNELPHPDVMAGLFKKDKGAYYCLNYDADSFFIKLSRELGIFPPQIMKKPFSHLLEIFESITDFPLENENTQISLTEHYKKFVGDAAKKYGDLEKIEKKNNPNVIAMKMAYLFASERYEYIVSLDLEIIEKLKDGQKDYLVWSYISLGNKLAEQGENEKGEEKKRLYRESYEKYRKAIEIAPDMYETYYNWGVTLSDQAECKQGKEADRLYQESYEKYGKAVEIKPDAHEAYNNWGLALYKQASSKEEEEADRLYRESYEKYGKVIEINPNAHEAYNNWGLALSKQASSKQGEEADRLYRESCEKYGKAVEINPDAHEAYYNWGNALYTQANSKRGEEADRLYREAYEKYGKAVEIKPDMHEAYYNWGNALSEQDGSKGEEESNRLYQEAYEKYGKAVEIKPDKHEAYNNWGLALFEQAKRNPRAEADSLYRESYEKYGKVVEIKPDYHDAYYNWGNALYEQASSKQGEEADRLYRESYEKYAKAIEIRPDDYGTYTNWGSALIYQAKSKKGDEAIRLLQEAFEKLIRAKENGFYNLACIESLRGNPAECRKWLLKAQKAGTLPSKNHLMNDTDLDNVRDHDWFKEFMASLQS